MPIVQITVVQGRSTEALQRCIRNVAHTVSESLDAPLSSVRVMINQIEPELFAVGDTPKSFRPH